MAAPKQGDLSELSIRARFIACWAGIVLVGVLAVVGFFVVMTTEPKHVAHQSDIASLRSQLGASTREELIKEAETAIAESAKSSNLTLTLQQVTSFKRPDRNTVVIVIHVHTAEYGDANVKATFRKGIWSMGNLESA